MGVKRVPAAEPRPGEGGGEGELLKGLRAGDAEAFERLVRTSAGRMLAVARRYLQSEEDAQDAVQDAYLSAFRALPHFHGEARLTTWLHRIVVNACLMKLRTRRRKPEEVIDDLLPHYDEEGHRTDPTPAWRQDAETLALRQETRRLVQDSIARLPDAYRAVLLMRDIDGLDTAEAARLLGITPQAVKTRLHRARQALRTLLDPHLREGSVA